MAFRKRLLEVLAKVYSPISPFARKLGFHNFAKRMYEYMRPKTRTINIAGTTGKFDINDKRDESWLSGFNDKSLSDLLSSLQEDDIVYNVGAHIGIHAILIANTIPRGEVFAFEPHPQNADRIRTNVKLNKGKVRVIEKVMSDESGEVDFQIKSSEGGIGTHSITTGTGGRTITRESVTGDKLVSEGITPIPNIVSIDVEGAELRVVEGLENTLKKPECRAIYIEVHLPTTEQPFEESRTTSIEDFGDSPEELHNKLTEMGYTLEKLEEMDDRYSIKATKT